jgi:hypothetical protein
VAAAISANPSPVAFPWPRVLGTGADTEETTITWSTGSDTRGRVFLSVDGGPETLFDGDPQDGNRQGTKAATIEFGRVPEFRLKQANAANTLLASVTVTTGEAPILPLPVLDPRLSPRGQGINDVTVRPRIDDVTISFRTRQPTNPFVEVVNTANGEVSGLWARPEKKQSHTMVFEGYARPMAQDTTHRYRIVASPMAGSFDPKKAEATGTVRTGSRAATFFFDEVFMRNAGDPSETGEFTFVFGGGDADTGEGLGNLERYGEASIEEGETVPLNLSVRIKPSPRRLWVEVVATEDDSYYNPFDPGIRARGLAPTFSPAGSTIKETEYYVRATVQEHFDLSDTVAGSSEMPIRLATGPFAIAFDVIGRLRVETQPGEWLSASGPVGRLRPTVTSRTLRTYAVGPGGSALVSADDGHAHAIACDRDGAVYHRRIGDVDGAWTALGGRFEGILTTFGEGGVWLFGLSPDASLFYQHRAKESAAREWRLLGGGFDSPLAAVAGGEAVDLLATRDRSVFHRALSAARNEALEGAWEPAGGGAAGSIVALRGEGAGLSLFVLGRGGEILHRHRPRDAEWEPGDSEKLGTVPPDSVLRGQWAGEGSVLLSAVAPDETVFVLAWTEYPDGPPSDGWQAAGTVESLLQGIVPGDGPVEILGDSPARGHPDGKYRRQDAGGRYENVSCQRREDRRLTSRPTGRGERLMNGYFHQRIVQLRIVLFMALALVLMALLLAVAGPAQAATFTVDNGGDSSAANACAAAADDCSLRGAISQANGAVGTDTIDFAPGISTVTLTTVGTPHEDNNVSGDLDIRDDLTLNGGSGVTIQGGTGWSERVIDIIGNTVALRTDVTISDATIRNGNATVGGIESSKGGGIQVNGNATVSGGAALTLVQSTVTDNTAVGIGGGIYDAGGSSITLQDSTVSNNTAGNNVNGGGGGISSSGPLTISGSRVTGNEGVDLGGGIFVGSPATLDMTGSTVSGNTAASSGSNTNGGGIWSQGSVTLTRSTLSNNTAEGSTTGAGEGGGLWAGFGSSTQIVNTTVSGNTAKNGSNANADGKGGGIYFSTTLTLANATIASNKAGDPGTGGRGGGIFGDSGSSTTLRNSIIAANNADISPNFAATPTSQGYNLLGENPGNLTTTDIVNANPLLAPLADNGGPTQTHALLTGSPAIDAANPAPPGDPAPACEANDQREVARLQDGDGDTTARCDIGAFEKAGGSGGTDPTLSIDERSIKEGNRGTKSMVFTITLSASNTQSVTVDYATADGKAKAPGDYAAQGGTLTFAPGDTTKTITVPIVGDRRRERNEAFFVNLSNASNATIGDPQGRGTIRNND